MDVREDRIRAMFLLTTDDPLPKIDDETQLQYLAFLKEHLTFPFKATYYSDHGNRCQHLDITGFPSDSPIDLSEGIICEAREEKKKHLVP